MLGGNLLLATTVEDYVYWLVLDKTPYTWMPLYVVWGGYVINDIVQGVLVIVLYYAYFRLEMKKMKKDN
jgi:Na+-driven multidrug efflux pump